MTREVLLGTVLIVTGVILFLSIFPEDGVLLTIFLGLAILSLFLRIKHCEEEKPGEYDYGRPEETWSTRHPIPYFILIGITLVVGSVPIPYSIGNGWSLQVVIQSSSPLIILFGLYFLPALFDKHNYQHNRLER